MFGEWTVKTYVRNNEILLDVFSMFSCEIERKWKFPMCFPTPHNAIVTFLVKKKCYSNLIHRNGNPKLFLCFSYNPISYKNPTFFISQTCIYISTLFMCFSYSFFFQSYIHSFGALVSR